MLPQLAIRRKNKSILFCLNAIIIIVRLFIEFSVPPHSPSHHGSKAKLIAAENSDVLDVTGDDEDLFLSEVDDTPPKVKSVVIRPTTGSNSKRVEPAVDLFPNAPTKIKTSETDITTTSTGIQKEPTLLEFNIFERKKANRSKHPSSIPRKDNHGRITKPPSRDLTNTVRDIRERFLRNNQPKRIVEVIASANPQRRQQSTRPIPQPLNRPPTNPPNRPPNRSPKRKQSRSPNQQQNRPSAKPATVTSGENNSVFARLDSYRIPKHHNEKEAPVQNIRETPKKPKEYVSTGTQTELSGPCRCTIRNQIKNKNRRQAFKLNRDLVKKFKLDNNTER